MTAVAAVLSRGRPAFAYDAAIPPCATVEPGERVTFETDDARGGTLLAHPPGVAFALTPAPAGAANPLTGPLAVNGAEPGDSLVVTIEAIEVGPAGFCGAFAKGVPVAPGRIPQSLGRVCAVADGEVAFAEGINVPVTPMIGCAGTAPAGAVPGSLRAGRFGGNMDQRPLAPGARLHLPVFVPGGLLFVGDVHAAQGDGELSGFGLETGARVTATIDLRSGAGIAWPWLETAERTMVLTAGETFEAARDAAVECVLAAVEAQRGLVAAEALMLISLAGDLRVGQAFGAPDVTVRLELPATLGLHPQ